MRQSKTTIKELTAMYRAVLRYGILCNAIALGLCVVPAGAEVDRQSVNTTVVWENQNVTDQDFLSTDPVTRDNNPGFGGYTFIDRPGNLTVNNSNYSGLSFDGSGGVFATRIPSGNITAELHVNDSTFTNNHAHYDGGAIGNYNVLSVSGSTFEGNTALLDKDAEDNYTIKVETSPSMGGGAVALGAESMSAIVAITDSNFINNKSGKNGGAITTRLGADANNAAAKLDVSANFSGNEALEKGGAIYNSFYGNNGLGKGDGVTVNGNFSSNRANDGGAIYNDGTADKTGHAGGVMTVYDSVFTNNTAADRGGAIYNDGTMNIANVEFTNNSTTTGGDLLVSEGGAVYNKGTLTINDALFDTNSALYMSGAVFNSGNLTINNGLFKNNYASADESTGGAIYNGMNGSNLVLNDTSFENNHVDGEDSYGGAIGNTSGTVTINAKNKDVVFIGNVADGKANDIDNTKGTVNLNAADGRKITLNGGIDSWTSKKSSTIVNVNSADNQTGTIEINGTLNKQNVNVAAGELHLGTGSSMTGSAVNVASGATMNTQDGSINNYASQITLADGSRVMADANATSIDKFAIVSDGTITLNGLKMLSDLDVDSVNRNLATSGNINIGDDVKVYTTANKYALTGNTSNNGVLKIEKNGVGGLKSAAVDTGNVTYTITGDDTSVDTDTTITNNDLLVKGAGTEAGDNSVKLAANLAVADDASLTIEDAKIENQDGENSTIENQQGATLTILNSKISTNINNAGVMYSDPTYYDAQVVNTGTATFDSDVFENGSSLTNSATVDLNNVEFAAGSTLTGLDGNVLNVSGTSNAFNGTSSGNNVKLASGANYSGTLSNGSVDARNNTIDTVTGSVSGGNLYVDANLASGDIDTFGGTSGATVKGIALANTGYGNSADSVSLDMGGATLDSDVDISGTNYYTSVTQSGNNVVFGDKLMNTSGTHTLLGDWNAGNYIGKSNTYNAATASYDNDGTTVGAALTALDTQAKTNADNIALKANSADVYTKTEADSLLNEKQNTLTAGSGVDITDNTISVSGITASNIAANAAIAKTQLASDVQTLLGKADSALQSHQTVSLASGTNNGTVKLTVGETVTDNIAITGLGETAYTNLAANIGQDNPSDDQIAAWAYTNGDKVANVATTFDVLGKKLTNVESDLLTGTGDNAHSIAHALGATGTTTLQEQVGVLAKANAAQGAYDSSLDYDANTIGAAIKGKQDTLTAGNGVNLTSNTVSVKAANTTIAVDGNGVKVGTITDANIADGSISQGKINGLESALSAKMSAADWTVNEGANLNGAKLADGSVTTDKIASSAMVQGTDTYAASTQLTSKGYVDQKIATIESAGYQTSANVVTAINNAKNNTALTGNTTAENLTVGGNAVLTTANTTTSITANSESLITSGAVYAGLNGKQDTLTAGNGIDLTSNTVSVKAANTTIAVDGNGVKVGTITDANIADGSISQGKINGLESALSAKMSAADWTVNEGANLNGAKLADGSVTTDKIASSAMVQGTDTYAASTQLTSKGYVDQKIATIESAGYQTSANVVTAINNAKNNTALTGNTTAENLTVGGNAVLTTANTTTSIAENSESLITSGAVYAGLSGKQDVIDADNKLSAGLIETSTDAQFVTADEKTAWNNKQDAIDADHKLSAGLVSGLSTVATSGKASDLTNDAGFIGTSDLVTELTSSATDDQVVSAKAVYDAINDSLTGGGVVEAAVENAMAGVTTMQHTQEQIEAGETYNNFEENTSVTEAVAALDTAVATLDAHTGKVHGLISKTGETKTFNGTNINASKNKDSSGNYVGNLAVGTTTEDHLVALDNAIGSLSTLNTTNGVLDNTASVATNLQNLDTAINNVATYSNAQANLALNQSVAYTNERVSELDKELSSGIASAVALSSVAVSNVERGEVSVGAGYGYYNGRSAAAFGAAMGLSNRWSVNAGAGVSDADVSFRAGTNYKFKLF